LLGAVASAVRNPLVLGLRVAAAQSERREQGVVESDGTLAILDAHVDMAEYERQAHANVTIGAPVSIV
jgi:hypothetical protein